MAECTRLNKCGSYQAMQQDDVSSLYISRNYNATNDSYGGTLGYTGNDVGPEYIVTIRSNAPSLYSRLGGVRSAASHSRREIIIRTVLQEKFEMTTESDWRPLTAAALVSRFAYEAFALAHRAPLSRWLTRRIWQGTTPLDFTLNLRFEAEYNAEREVLLPCKELQRMCLPYVGGKVLGNWFLSPPGPAALELFSSEGEDKGEIIDISIGSFLKINKCVVKAVKVSYNNKFQTGGYPLSAVVTINFQTYEIQTKESLDGEVYLQGGRANVTSVGQGQRPSITSSSSGVLRK